jgi:glycerol-3-phosphate dehydrogenase (NAD(P)+)
MGLSGLGDLVLTATGDLSRNRRVGMLLAQGQSLRRRSILWAMWPKASTAPAPWRSARRALGVDMPITRAVVALLDGRLAPADAVGG